MNRRKFIKDSILLTSGVGLSYCSGNAGGNKIKVAILGFDGAGWATIDPLIEKGKLPYLKMIRDNSAWGDFQTIKPTKSNVVWTSIVTGKSMLKHGILDFAYHKKDGAEVPYSKIDRNEPAIWQILNSYNMSSTVLNWWVSHPPDKVKGVMVSDHFRNMADGDHDNKVFIPTVHPPSYFEQLEPLAKKNKDYHDVLRRTGLPDFYQQYESLYPDRNIARIPVLNIYKKLIKHDGMIESASRHLWNTLNTDFFATYFRFPDITQHFITHFMDKEFKVKLKAGFKEGNVSSDMLNNAIEMVSDLMFPLYRYMERIIKEYVESEKGKDTYFMIMSDHGFSFYKGGYNHYNLPDKMPAPDGIFLMHGPKVRAGKLENVGVYDVAPTVLNLLDLPIGKNMDGKVLKNALKINNRLRYKEYRLKKDSDEKTDENFQKEKLEELKSIGYL